MSEISLRERQHQLREEAILEAANELLAMHGYTGMSMDDLAERVGISKATLYQHFPSKEELATRAFVQFMYLGEQFIQRQDPNLPAIERLEQLLRFIITERFGNNKVDFHTAAPELLCVLKNHLKFRVKQEQIYNLITKIVEEAKDQGDILSDLSTPIVINLFLTCLHTNYEEALRSGKCTLEELSNNLVKIIFNGIRSRQISG